MVHDQNDLCKPENRSKFSRKWKTGQCHAMTAKLHCLLFFDSEHRDQGSAFLLPLPTVAFMAAVNRAKNIAHVLIRGIADIERVAAEATNSLFLSIEDAIRFWDWPGGFAGNRLNPIANYEYIVELNFADLSTKFHRRTNEMSQSLESQLTLSH